MSKLEIWHQGDRSEALCEKCDGWRETEFRYRPFRLAKAGVTVPDVLVGVCVVCDTTATIPQQSAPKLKAALQKAPGRIDARIPKELRDVIGVLAADFGGETEPFAGGMLRYYMRAMTEDEVLARRIRALAASADARGTPGGRIAFRLDKRLMADALSTFGDHKSDSKSSLVRGIIVAAKQDAYDSPNKGRLNALKAIAAAALV